MYGKIFSALAVVALVIGLAGSADASLAIGDANYVGLINPGSPASLAQEASKINILTTLAPGAGPITNAGDTYDRIGSSLVAVFPAATDTGAVKQEGSATTFNLGTQSYQYILAKYDGQNYGSAVWYFAGGISGNVMVPAGAGSNTAGQPYGLSHISAFNPVDFPPGPEIPEPATVIAWLLLLPFAAAMIWKRRRGN